MPDTTELMTTTAGRSYEIAAATGTKGRHVEHPPEPPHFIQVWFQSDYADLKYAGENPYGDPDPSQGFMAGLTPKQVLHVGTLEKPVPLIGYAPWENHVFFGIGCLTLVLLTLIATRSFRRSREEVLRRPTRSQALLEAIVGGSDDFVAGILGPENGRRYLPYVGSLFFIVLINNLMGLVPLMKASTSAYIITGSLAIATFGVYMWTALTRLGPLVLLHHLLGSPQNLIQWILSPLFLVLECISFFIAKPLSLSLRLMGNILGKDILMGSFMFMGIAMAGIVGLDRFIGVPLTIPFYFLGLLLSTIQALVFALLSAIYILLVLPHDHDHEHDEHHHGEAHGHAAAH